MRKTPQEFKRVAVKAIIDKVLGEDKTILKPLSISVHESSEEDLTLTSFSFSASGHKKKNIEVNNQKGRGFVDSLFAGLHGSFLKEFKSLERIKLQDLKVNPLIGSAKTSLAADAPISVLLSVYVEKNGIAEFQNKSHSIINSSFVIVLEAFQFYINCERVFDKIQLIMKDAKSRNRGDLVSQSMYDLSKITEVNNYERKKEN